MRRFRKLHNLAPSAGFNAAMAALGLGADEMARGSQNLVPSADERLRAWKGMAVQAAITGGLVMMPASDGYVSLGSGSAAVSVADSLFYAGSGPLRFNGAALGALSASSTISFLLRSGASYGTTAYQAGRVAPSPPAVTARDNVGGKMTGGFTIKTTRINPDTGGESDASEATPVFQVSAGKAIVSFDGIALDGNGQKKWGFYGSRFGLQTSGRHFGLLHYPEVDDTSLTTILGIPRAVEIEWDDNGLDFERLAPTDNDPPPAVTHVAAIENIVLAFGCFGGNGVISSKVGYLESFPLENLTFLPERPVAVYPRPNDGFILVGCPGSMHAAVYSGQSTPPFALQTVWGETGIAAHHNVCFTEDAMFVFVKGRGIARASGAGAPDFDFSKRVAEYCGGWSAENVVAGYDQKTQHVPVFHGSEALVFNKQTGKWGGPLKLSALRPAGVNGTVRSCVTHQGALYVCVEIGGSLVIYRYHEGGTGSTAIYQSPWMKADAAQETLRRIKIALEGSMNNAATLQIFIDGDDGVAARTFNIPAQAGGSRLRHLKAFKPNVKNVESYALRLTIASDDGTEALVLAETFAAASGRLL